MYTCGGFILIFGNLEAAGNLNVGIDVQGVVCRAKGVGVEKDAFQRIVGNIGIVVFGGKRYIVDPQDIVGGFGEIQQLADIDLDIGSNRSFREQAVRNGDRNLEGGTFGECHVAESDNLLGNIVYADMYLLRMAEDRNDRRHVPEQGHVVFRIFGEAEAVRSCKGKGWAPEGVILTRGRGACSERDS